MSARALGLSLAFAAAAAQASAPAANGVWRGTLGKQSIYACFDDGFDSYYYTSRRHGISLHEDEGRLVEQEPAQEPTGTWRIEGTAGGLTGTWTAPDGKRVLPIRLQQVGTLGPDELCEQNAAYNAPRLASAPIGPATTAMEAGLRVQRAKVGDADVERVRIELPEPAGSRINAALAEEFRQQLSSAYACGDYSSTTGLALVQSRWVVLRTSVSLFCGGAHPDAYSRNQVFDVGSGERIDTSKWLRPASPERPDAALWALLARKAAPDGECTAAWDGRYAELQVMPSTRGVLLVPSFVHAIQACEDEVELSLDEAAPFLSAAARRELSPRR